MTRQDTSISEEDLRLTAFPCRGPHQDSEGMSLREYFAAHSPLTFADAVEHWRGKSEVNYEQVIKTLASMNYAYADEMLRKRKP